MGAAVRKFTQVVQSIITEMRTWEEDHKRETDIEESRRVGAQAQTLKKN